MELKLVYRVLRKISDWTVTGYYSETYVEGQANVPEDGPIIIAATHHNEIIDIATLAVTIPHRRPLSFWAKSTMFANPIFGAILSSSGAIPVRRNPNGNGPPGASNGATATTATATTSSPSSSNTELSARSALFLNTSKVLEANQVVGVFPEGASYTYANILQIMPGTAWAAVEYARYLHEGGKKQTRTGSGNGKGKEMEVDTESKVSKGLRIVPVAIVYTNKSKYQSRVYVKYGEPIFMDSYAEELFQGDADKASKAVVKKITIQLQKQLSDMTANAPDWDTVCAVSMARSILWGDEGNIPLKDWVEVSQRLVDMLVLQSQDDSPTSRDSVLHLKQALTRYFALLHYAGMRHSVLLSLLPLSSSFVLDIPPSHTLPSNGMLKKPTLSILFSLPLSLIRFVLFLPPFLLHFPGYITGRLLAKALSVSGEEEGLAQYKAVGGGFGIGANIALALGVLWKQNKLGTLIALLGLEQDSSLKCVLGLVGTIYCSVVVLVKWHKLLVRANYRQLQRLMTYYKLFSAFALPRLADELGTAEVDEYSKPPLPAINFFIKRKDASSQPSSSSSNGDSTSDLNTSDARKPLKPIASWKLVRHVLHARTAACAALSAHLKAMEDEILLAFLTSKGAKIPVP